MSIFAISDLHLAFDTKKPMDIFGDNWKNHEEKIMKNWLENVKEDDLVLLPGDFSWAINLQETYKDFEYLENLPGKKLLLKGNHDYWWNTLAKMRKYLKENNFSTIDFLCNNSYCYENYIITGTRGWINNESEEDEKIIRRELIRLELSLKDGTQKYGNDKELIVNMHYPPFSSISKKYSFIELMKKYNVTMCIYGHLHGPSYQDIRNIEGTEIKFYLVSCDYLKFKVLKLK